MARAAVHLLVQFTINDEQFAAFEDVAREMTAGSQAEPGTLAYEWYVSSDRKQGRLLESYTSGDALLAHFNGPVVQQLLPKMRQSVTIDRFEAYGDPGPQMNAVLANFGTQAFGYWGGWTTSACARPGLSRSGSRSLTKWGFYVSYRSVALTLLPQPFGFLLCVRVENAT
jgi:quinol monooxygenase YgiN